MKARLRRWLALAPLVAPALAATCAVAAAERSCWAWAGIGLALAGAAWADRRRGILLVVTAVVVVGGLHGWRQARLRAHERLWAGGEPAAVALTGTVAARPQLRGAGWSAPVRIRQLIRRAPAGPAPAEPAAGDWGRVWWSGRGQPPLAGSQLAAAGLLRRPAPPRNPGELDHAGWLARRGVWAEFEPVDGPMTAVAPPHWRQRVESWRDGFRAAIIDGLEPGGREAAVILAMVLGDRPADDDELIAAFRNSGALHVFSVSGLHVGLVGLCLWWALRLLRVPRRLAVLLLVPAMFAYAWLAGMQAPAVRAAWMAALLLGGFLLRRPAGLVNVLAAVAIGALAIDGNQLYQPGFQLTYGVVAAIGLLGGACTRLVSGPPVVDPFLPRPLWTRGHEWATATQRWLAGSLGVSLAATAGSTPLIGWHFHMATPIAPLASLALIPVTMVLLALALAAAAIAPVAPPLTRALNHLNAGVARASVAIAEGAARVPGSHFMLPSPGRRTEELVVFDLPYGAAAVLFDPGKDGVFLLDCGDQWSVRQSLLPALRHAGRNLTDLLLSHPDGGHLGGAATLCRADPPARVFLPVGDARSPGFQRLLAAAPASGATLTMLQAGQTIDCAPHARWVVVATADPRDRDALADDRCALLRLEWHGWRILFTADSGFRTERKLVESRADLAADVLVLGRHRTDPGGSEPFLAAVGARIVIASHDEFPPAERLAGPLRARLAAGGATVISQGEAGAVILTATSGHLTARGFLGGPQAGLCRSGAGGR